MFNEDLSVFFSDFSIDCIYNGQALKGILDNQGTDSNIFNSFSISGSNPKLTVKYIDCSLMSITINEKITVDSVEYKIKNITNDGTGLTVLDLELV